MHNILTENNVRICDDVLTITSKILKIDKKYLSIEKNLSEFNLTSLSITEMVHSINELYDISISPANIYGHKTISSFIEFLLKTYKSKIVDYYNDVTTQVPLESNIKDNSLKRQNELRTDRKHLILLSADNEDVLKNDIKRLLGFIEENLENVGFIETLEYSLISKSHEKKHRLAIVVDDLVELFQKLTDFIECKKNVSSLYYSEIEQDNSQIKLFLLSSEAKQLPFKWINNNEVEKLALLWINSIPIELETIFKQDTAI